MAANPHVSQFNRVLSTTDNETGMAKDSLAHTISTSALCFVLDLALSRTTVVPRLRVGPHIFLSRFELKGYVYDESHGLHHMPGILFVNGDTAFHATVPMGCGKMLVRFLSIRLCVFWVWYHGLSGVSGTRLG